MSDKEQAPETKQSNSKNSSNSNSNSGMDTSNPYYVHSSDHPGHMLVPTKLNGANYPPWSKSKIHALTAKNKIGFVNGSIKPPSETENPTKYAFWNQCNSMILSWFAHSVEPDLAKGVVHTKTAHQVWEDFKDQFSQKNAPTIYQIQKSIASLTQGTMTVSAYFTKLKGLWDELETYRTPLTCNEMKAHNKEREEDKMMQFLMGLNDTFSGVRSSILMITPLPKVRQAYSLVIQDETQRQMTSGTTENFSIATAIQSRPNNSKNKHCDHCDRNGHQSHGFVPHAGSSFPSAHAAQQVGSSSVTQPSQNPIQAPDFSAHTFLSGLTSEQYQQLATAMSLVNTNASSSGNNHAFVNAVGLGYREDDWYG
ncbi:uncharacterized protein LOC110746704 [Prunus avium]|uniref:Uncharacterized protein LOC110746704 n=1 Tax=Prunus avium TaxID=42229 RepID=A0A6P5RCJ3_PRUAV|nr:uncharacterized protein LOC110746704 [Prunus avium]